VSDDVGGTENDRHCSITGISHLSTPREVDGRHDGVPHADQYHDRHRRYDIDVLQSSHRKKINSTVHHHIIIIIVIMIFIVIVQVVYVFLIESKYKRSKYE